MKWSLDRLAGRVSISAGMVGAIERGVRRLQPQQAEELDNALGSGDQIARLLAHVSRGGVPLWIAELEPLLGRAAEIRQWQLGWIPGLLQTADYARAALRAAEAMASDDQIDEYVRARMRRQHVVWEEPQPRCTFVLDEAVLTRPVGSEDVMRAQLDRVLSMSAHPNVTVQVAPVAASPHAGLDGSFQLLRLPDEPHDVLVLETRFGADLDHAESNVKGYIQDFEDLRAVALSPATSVEMIRMRSAGQ